MEIKKISAVGNSCNFCRAGKLALNGLNLIRPYTEVYEVIGTGVGVNICPSCMLRITTFSSQSEYIPTAPPNMSGTLNQWFLALEKEEQEHIRDDKWMLAERAFDAGRISLAKELVNLDMGTAIDVISGIIERQ